MANVEKDYLVVAQRESEEAMLDTHWKRCAETQTWFKSSGGVKKFSELDNQHLTFIIKMLVRFLAKRKSNHLEALINSLINELSNRKEKK